MTSTPPAVPARLDVPDRLPIDWSPPHPDDLFIDWRLPVDPTGRSGR